MVNIDYYIPKHGKEVIYVVKDERGHKNYLTQEDCIDYYLRVKEFDTTIYKHERGETNW